MPIFCVQDNQHGLGLVIEQTKREENMKRKDQANFTTYYDKKRKKTKLAFGFQTGNQSSAGYGCSALQLKKAW